MNKITGLAAGAAALGLYAADVNAQAVRNDDGRPSVARTWGQRNYDETEWYLSFPLIPHLSFNNVKMFGDSYDLAVGIFDLQKPEGDILSSPESFENFAEGINGLPRVNGNLNVSEIINFGILSEWFELHAYGGGYSRADFRFKGLNEDYSIALDPATGMLGVDFGREQTAFIGRGIADLLAGANFVVPVHIGDFILKPWLGFGYRHREHFAASLTSDRIVTTEDSIHYPGDKPIRSNGNGWFMNTGLMADFSRWETYIRPVAALSIDNAYSEMYYAENPAGLPFIEPLRVNVGMEISPMDWFNVRADFLNVNNSPEYRIEAARRLDWAEFSVFGRLNERTLLGDYRHSLNVMLGFGNDIAQVRLYGSMDQNIDWGVGLQFGLGWRVSEFM
ncbi:MAG: hypothetical protein QME12_07685 [Nanoarchaeota archaeon]|nr:hypothetical protein [Nanoarchaeota archaeon]